MASFFAHPVWFVIAYTEVMNRRLTDQVYLQKLLQQYGIKPNRSAGQNFLICDEVVEATVALLKDAPRRVTELGAGLGVLTGPLLAAGYSVRAIERDQTLATILQKNIPASFRRDTSSLDLQTADLRYSDWSWSDEFCVVGNIPYNLSGLIIRKITQLEPVPERVVLLVQQEVARRLVAQTPNLQLMALAVQLWGRATEALAVPRSCFWPVPKVDSQLVILEPRANNSLTLETREKVLSLARGFFQAKRKQIGGGLKRDKIMTTDEVARMLDRVNLKPAMRPQEVTMQQWVQLLKEL